MNFNNKKKIILGSIITLILIISLGVTYAFFTFGKTSLNSQLVAGDIYMKYKETNSINIPDMMPRSTYVDNENGYFEFEITGKNTYAEKDIIYDVVLSYGDTPTDPNRTIRIKDELLRFRLVKVVNNEEQEIFTDRSYVSINNTRIHKETIPAETNTEITTTYRIYAWIGSETKIGNTEDADYSLSDWNKVFASIKVNVTGDFNDKKVPKLLYDIIRANSVSDNESSEYVTSNTGIKYGEKSSNNNGRGIYKLSSTNSANYPIYFYRGEVNDNNVLFANMCWKTVRTTDTGGVKLIYNGLSKLKNVSFNDLTSNSLEPAIIFDPSDNSWNMELHSSSAFIFEFSVSSGGDYLLEITGTTTSSSGTSIYILKDSSKISSGGNGGGNPINMSTSLNSLTNTNVIRITNLNPSSNSSDTSGPYLNNEPITIKIKTLKNNVALDYDSYNLKTMPIESCDNSYTNTQLTSSKFNNQDTSIGDVGYMYGKNVVLQKRDSTISNDTGIKYGSGFEFNNNTYTYTLTGVTATYSESTKYTCFNSSGTCTTASYIVQRIEISQTGKTYSYYFTVNSGQNINEVLEDAFENNYNSNIKGYLDYWASNNLSSKIQDLEDTIYCNDRSFADPDTIFVGRKIYFNSHSQFNSSTNASYDSQNVSVDLTCPQKNDSFTVNESINGNGKLTYPVGLITVPECILAGVILGYTSANYLNNNSQYWTMTPKGYENGHSLIAFYSGGGSGGYISYDGNPSTTVLGVRPVVSIKNSKLVIKGNGTVDNPYVIA